MTFYTWHESPAGRLLLAGSDEGIERLHFSRGAMAASPDPLWRLEPEAFRETLRQLDAYFDGSLREFSLITRPVGTLFQLRVWRELQSIPYGQTVTYGELARRIGNPSASRAVGLANGANPIAIVIPCHRVIGAGGKLTGFGGGLDVKAKLLALERGEVALNFYAPI
jgi:methylated-DNA-[protein]-cysteine S-methyltransferase